MMNKKSISFVFLLLMASMGFSQDYSEDYEFYYINGMFTNPAKDLEENRSAIQSNLRAALGDNGIYVDVLPNDDSFFLKQLLDVFVEKSGESGNSTFQTRDFWEMYFKVLSESSIYLDAVRAFSYQLRDIEVGPYSQKDLDNMIGLVRGSLDGGKKVVLVPHSQGNFFYKNIVNSLDISHPDEIENCSAGVGLATPLSNVYGNYSWVTNSNDWVINGVRLVYPDTLLSNITIPYSPDDKLGHGIVETYMSDPASIQSFRNKVIASVSYMEGQCNELPPKGDISFELTWSYSGSSSSEGPDIDLWVEGPLGRLSASRDGYGLGPDPIGGLIDHDDLGGYGAGDGGGPERAFWPMGESMSGSYNYGVRYYQGNGNVSYKIRVFVGQEEVKVSTGYLTSPGQAITSGSYVFSDGSLSTKMVTFTLGATNNGRSCSYDLYVAGKKLYTAALNNYHGDVSMELPINKTYLFELQNVYCEGISFYYDGYPMWYKVGSGSKNRIYTGDSFNVQ